MSRATLATITLLLLTSLGRAQSRSPAAAADPEIERKFRADVEAANPAAAPLYDQANAARDAEKLDEAIDAYRKVIELAPAVDHPHRRLCSVLAAKQQIDEAMRECERARELAPDSPYDRYGLAGALIARNGAGDLDRAIDLLQDAANELPKDVLVHQAWCVARWQQGNNLKLPSCATRLLALDPSGMVANLVGAIVAGDRGDYDEARAHLRKAKAAGLDQTTYSSFSDKLDEVEDQNSSVPRWARHAFWAGIWIIGAWLAVMIVLLVAGFVLSRAMLRSVNRSAASSADAMGSDSERRVRKIYKAVLLLSGVYFYLSMPLMLLTIIGAGGGLIFGFVAMGVIPIKLVVVIFIIVIATVGAILRSLFVRSDSKPPGEAFDLSRHPKLQALLGDVAGAVGTRPVDRAYLTPGTEMAVTERGGLWTSLRGKRTERSLITGVALFDGMTQVQLRSILAHEYGHFRNEDTAGGGFALAVRRSLITLIVRLAQSGAAGAFNPVWWFVRGFYRVYLGMSQGASRLQEVLADRWAIKAYGSEAFIGGYKHVVARSVEFDHDVDSTIKEVIEKRRALPNLYRYEPDQKRHSDADIATKIEQELAREPSAYDSHPAPRQRLEWATQLAVPRNSQPEDGAPVWELFADREELERAMTTTVRERIYANHGVLIPDAAKPSDADVASRVADPAPSTAGAGPSTADAGRSTADPGPSAADAASNE